MNDYLEPYGISQEYDQPDNYIQEFMDSLIDGYQNIMSEASINFAKTKKRVARHITDKDELNKILSIDHFKASEKNTVMELFANFGDDPAYNPYDIITIPAKAYGGLSKKHKDYTTCSNKTNSNPIKTTIGLYIFNKSFIEPISDVLGYINESITADVYGDINQKMSYALLEDHITVDQLKRFISQTQIMMSWCSALAPSDTELMFSMQEQISKKKKQLLSQPKYKNGIANNDLTVMKDFEKELIDYAKEILRDDPAIDMFNSGARASWGNNFKTMYLLRSGITHTDGSVSIVTSSYMDGMDKEDFAAINDAAVGGPYSRSRKTAEGGYLERLLLLSTAHIKVLNGQDCGTTRYITINLDKKNIKEWYYSFIIEGNNLVELTPENASKYVGKTVKMRFSSLCKAKNGCICEKCTGTLFKRIGIENIGMSSSILGSSIKNANMKSFHSSVISLSDSRVEDYLNL